MHTFVYNMKRLITIVYSYSLIKLLATLADVWRRRRRPSTLAPLICVALHFMDPQYMQRTSVYVVNLSIGGEPSTPPVLGSPPILAHVYLSIGGSPHILAGAYQRMGVWNSDGEVINGCAMSCTKVLVGTEVPTYPCSSMNVLAAA